MSTIERCPACDAQVLAAPAGAGFLRCDACGMRFSRPRAKRDPTAWTARDDVGLGIHPALARRYKEREPGEEDSGGHERPDASGPSPVQPSAQPPGSPAVQPPAQPTVQLSPSLVDEGARELPAGRAAFPDGPEADTAIEARLSRPSAKSGSGPNTIRLADPPPVAEPVAGPVVAARRPNDTPVQRPHKRERPRPKEEPLVALEGFEILEQVGKGAMGRVFKARELTTGRVAAVKVLAPELAARPDFVARFEREGAALARVRHPGVVSILGSGASGELHYLSMDFVEGVSLRRILDDGPLAPARALGFARRIVQGLGAAHDVGVIHRDLKPENILVDKDDGEERLVLVDFGLAGIIDEKEDPHPNLTKSRMTMGTVNYMAPEQRTDAKRVDQRADLYATGVILYELLTGDLPLGRFALPTERGLPLPRSIDDVIVKALARTPEERYQRAAELDRDLAAIEKELSRAASMDTLVGKGASGAKKSDAPARDLSDAPSEVDARSSGARLAPGATPGASSSVARSRATSRSTDARGPEWHTAPPWVKRPELLWGILALAVGAIAGLWFAPGQNAPEGTPVDAPPLALHAEAGRVSATLGEGPAVAWRASTEGWRSEGGGLGFDPAIAGPGFSLLRAPDTLSGEVFDAVARVSVGEGGEGVGALAFTDADGRTGVGVAIRADGSCAVLQLVRGQPDLEPIPCALTGRAATLALRCVPAERSCVVSIDGKRHEGVAAAIDEGWTFSLGCRGTACGFAAP